MFELPPSGPLTRLFTVASPFATAQGNVKITTLAYSRASPYVLTANSNTVAIYTPAHPEAESDWVPVLTNLPETVTALSLLPDGTHAVAALVSAQVALVDIVAARSRLAAVRLVSASWAGTGLFASVMVVLPAAATAELYPPAVASRHALVLQSGDAVLRTVLLNTARQPSFRIVQQQQYLAYATAQMAWVAERELAALDIFGGLWRIAPEAPGRVWYSPDPLSGAGSSERAVHLVTSPLGRRVVVCSAEGDVAAFNLYHRNGDMHPVWKLPSLGACRGLALQDGDGGDDATRLAVLRRDDVVLWSEAAGVGSLPLARPLPAEGDSWRLVALVDSIAVLLGSGGRQCRLAQDTPPECELPAEATRIPPLRLSDDTTAERSAAVVHAAGGGDVAAALLVSGRLVVWRTWQVLFDGQVAAESDEGTTREVAVTARHVAVLVGRAKLYLFDVDRAMFVGSTELVRVRKRRDKGGWGEEREWT